MQKVKATEFAQLSEEEQKAQASTLSESGLSDSCAAAKLKQKVHSLEQEYGMSTSEMLKELSEGQLEENELISEWLMLLDVLEDTQYALGKA